MNNRNLVRGLFLMAIALLFGGMAFNYHIGQLSRAGPGLFPLLVSGILFVLGLVTVLRTFVVERLPLSYNVKNISLVLVGLVGFALLSQYLDMMAGIVFMVFATSYAGTSHSIKRNIQVSLGLIAVAFGFKYLLGLQLPLL